MSPYWQRSAFTLLVLFWAMVLQLLVQAKVLIPGDMFLGKGFDITKHTFMPSSLEEISEMWSLPHILGFSQEKDLTIQTVEASEFKYEGSMVTETKGVYSAYAKGNVKGVADSSFFGLRAKGTATLKAQVESTSNGYLIINGDVLIAKATLNSGVLNPNFYEAIQRLPTNTTNFEPYFQFFETWGTHYVRQVDLGGRHVTKITLTGSSVSTMNSKADATIQAGINFAQLNEFGKVVARSSGTATSLTVAKSNAESFSYGGNTYRKTPFAWQRSVKYRTMPLRPEVESYVYLAPEAWRETMQEALVRYIAKDTYVQDILTWFTPSSTLRVEQIDNNHNDNRLLGGYYNMDSSRPGAYPLGGYTIFEGASRSPKFFKNNVTPEKTYFKRDPEASPILVLAESFTQIWNDVFSDPKNTAGSLWRPDCPADYVELGHVWSRGYDKPSTSKIKVACIHKRCVGTGIAGDQFGTVTTKDPIITNWRRLSLSKWGESNNDCVAHTTTYGDQKTSSRNSFSSVKSPSSCVKSECVTSSLSTHFPTLDSKRAEIQSMFPLMNPNPVTTQKDAIFPSMTSISEYLLTPSPDDQEETGLLVSSIVFTAIAGIVVVAGVVATVIVCFVNPLIGGIVGGVAGVALICSVVIALPCWIVWGLRYTL